MKAKKSVSFEVGKSKGEENEDLEEGKVEQKEIKEQRSRKGKEKRREDVGMESALNTETTGRRWDKPEEKGLKRTPSRIKGTSAATMDTNPVKADATSNKERDTGTDDLPVRRTRRDLI